jgi:energy-coupling factor transport system ATP-binding protein
VTFGFAGKRPILNDLGFKVETGEFVVIVGENGSGKSTLLRLLAGLLKPIEGRIVVAGTEHGKAERSVGIVFQNPDHQMIADTIEQEVALGMELRGVKREIMRAKAEQLLQRFSLQPIRNYSPEAISGGQKQRVAIAAMLAAEPDFMLFDEPDSLLDAPSRKELMRGVEEIRNECGIVWTTANPFRMPDASRFLLLQDGQLEESSRADLSELSLRAAG